MGNQSLFLQILKESARLLLLPQHNKFCSCTWGNSITNMVGILLERYSIVDSVFFRLYLGLSNQKATP
jgi:hypothetical protein